MLIKQIDAALARIVNDEGVRILFAVESASRAWGFASTDSDYDVRFIYVHDLRSYLTVQPIRDIIERRSNPNKPRADILDVTGWDVRKALALFVNSNQQLFEWLHSPIVYHDDGVFAPALRKLEHQYFNPHAALYHCYAMAYAYWCDHLQGERIKLRMYLYVIRRVLCCLYIERFKQRPPVDMDTLIDVTIRGKNDALILAVNALLDEKRSGIELGEVGRIPVIHQWLDTALTRLKCEARGVSVPDDRPPMHVLDNLLFDTIMDIPRQRRGP